MPAADGKVRTHAAFNQSIFQCSECMSVKRDKL